MFKKILASITAGIILFGFRADAFSSVSPRLTILSIGDSQMVGALAQELNPLLRTKFHASVWSYGAWSSAPWNWLKGNFVSYRTLEDTPETGEPVFKWDDSLPRFSELMEQAKPDWVIVQQAGNMMSATDYKVERSMKRMIHLIHKSHAECFWIGPSNGRGRDPQRMLSLYKVMSRVAEEQDCTLVDSRPITHYPSEGGDGIHFDSLGSEGQKIVADWAKGIVAALHKK